jgi:hypothetical protein
MERFSEYTTHTIEARDFPAVGDKVHGVIMALAVTLVLPLGALSWRLLSPLVGSKTLLWIHICCQGLGLAMLAVGYATGVWTAIMHDEV